jgi:hypothetical protein
LDELCAGRQGNSGIAVEDSKGRDVTIASAGSQKWIQTAVNQKPNLLLGALQCSGAIGPGTAVTWASPLESDDYCEYKDSAALDRVGVKGAGLKIPLADFWPARGPVWDALGITSDGRPMLVEAKAHIPEAASPASKASSPKSIELISKSPEDARKFYSPRAKAKWNDLFYQYANRLAHQYFLKKLNGVESVLVFVYFLNADDVLGPMSEKEWSGAIRLIHAVLGLPKDLRAFGVYDAFLDARLL